LQPGWATGTREGAVPGELDRLDVAVLRMLVEQPRAGVREYARQLGVARGTVQARLDRLLRTGTLASYRPQLAPTAMGFAGLAYIHLNLAQGMLDETSRRLAAIPEIMEANAITGEADMLCQVVARDNALEAPGKQAGPEDDDRTEKQRVPRRPAARRGARPAHGGGCSRHGPRDLPRRGTAAAPQASARGHLY
jgi:DNA-binding Lrp family transcriptional regulator